MEDEIRRKRLEKIETIRETGADPYGRRVDGIEPIADVLARFEKEEEGVKAKVAGRLMSMRPHGNLTFADLRDRTGRIQLGFHKKLLGDAYAYIKKKVIDPGDIVTVEGEVGRTKTGEVTVFPESYVLLAKPLRPLPEKYHGLKDVELRSRMRYVDLFANPESMEVFVKRTKIVEYMRRHLSGRGFLEVETPMMQPIPGGAAARPFTTHHNALDIDLFLRVAPELYLKRLLVGGMERVFEINRNFRNEGVDRSHNPEFTMLEVYEAYSDYRGMMDLTEAILSGCAKEINDDYRTAFQMSSDEEPVEIDFTPPFARKTYDELFEEHVGFPRADEEAVRKKADEQGEDLSLPVPVLADILFEIFVEVHLVQPTFVYDYPVEICPLTKAKQGVPEIAERFELFIARTEIANAFTELNDPVVQRQRFEDQLEGTGVDGEKAGKKIDEDFITALEYGMPPAGGLGIGIDRVVMLLCGVPNIREVILFPLLKPKETAETRIESIEYGEIDLPIDKLNNAEEE
ncbi:MAG: lysine--tRNA ligase [Planctomycetota bacterium]|nr:MAG: lysine--tRNA ligase [Planctomycetota bacterium]